MQGRVVRGRRRGLAAFVTLAVAATGLTAVTLPGTAQATTTGGGASALKVQSVAAHDDKSVDITFNKTLGSDLLQFTDANTAYAGQYIRISGGADGTDAALDGRPLSEIAGTEVRPVDTAQHSTLRVVFGPSVRLNDAAYRLWFDGGADSLDDLFFRGDNGGALPGRTTAQTAFTGTSQDATTAAVTKVTALSTRSVEVTFASAVTSGMPNGAYTGNTISLTSGATTVTPRYVERVAGQDKKVYRLYFGSDLQADGAYQLTLGKALKLTTDAGASPADLVTPVTGSRTAWKPAEISAIAASGSGDQIRVEFSRKVAQVNPAGAVVPVKETATGVSGTTLTADQVRSLFTFSGVRTTTLRDAATVLRDDAAYFTDASTLYIKLDSGQRLLPGLGGKIALRPGALTDVTGAASTGTAAQKVSVPLFSLPKDTGYNAYGPDYLKVETHATTVFQRYDYSVNPDGQSVSQKNVKDKVVGETVKTIVAENKYIKATFAPNYGGRLLSIVYKPTGHDLLYTNPVGTPYGFSSAPAGTHGNSPFYKNWLMVWGGVFPTLTEAEHGKYWNTPWDYKIKQTGDSFSITVDQTDTVDYPDAPSKYVYGATGIETSVTYTLTKKQPQVGMTVSLHNPTGQDKKYEYWTCTTLAPGAGSHEGSPTMSIVAPAKEIYQDPSYTWMRKREAPANPDTPTDGYLKFDSLKKMENWDNNGIAYGQNLATLPQANWWGVINHENNEGVVRVGDNTKTPGMKIWEWGQNASFDTNVYAKGNSARPYIELWAGASTHFFTPATLKAGETLSWTESFIPTMDLGDVTNANTNGAAHVGVDAAGNVEARVFSTQFGQILNAALVDVTTGKTLTQRLFIGDELTAFEVDAKAPAGHQAKLVLTDLLGKNLLTAESGK